MAKLRTLYPPVEPYEMGMMDAGDDHNWHCLSRSCVIDRVLLL